MLWFCEDDELCVEFILIDLLELFEWAEFINLFGMFIELKWLFELLFRLFGEMKLFITPLIIFIVEPFEKFYEVFYRLGIKWVVLGIVN